MSNNRTIIDNIGCSCMDTTKTKIPLGSLGALLFANFGALLFQLSHLSRKGRRMVGDSATRYNLSKCALLGLRDDQNAQN